MVTVHISGTVGGIWFQAEGPAQGGVSIEQVKRQVRTLNGPKSGAFRVEVRLGPWNVGHVPKETLLRDIEGYWSGHLWLEMVPVP